MLILPYRVILMTLGYNNIKVLNNFKVCIYFQVALKVSHLMIRVINEALHFNRRLENFGYTY